MHREDFWVEQPDADCTVTAAGHDHEAYTGGFRSVYAQDLKVLDPVRLTLAYLANGWERGKRGLNTRIACL